MTEKETLTEEEILSINKGIEQCELGFIPSIFIHSIEQVAEYIEYILEFKRHTGEDNINQSTSYDELSSVEEILETAETKKQIWLLKISNEFNRSIKRIDRKLQGRILEAITYISENPLSTKGDTAKPLEGALKGLWRYRIGDFRLIYRHDIENNHIELLTFSGRGDVYE